MELLINKSPRIRVELEFEDELGKPLEEIPEKDSQDTSEQLEKEGRWSELIKIVGNSPILGDLKHELH